jgi:hypothetical protein
MGAFESHGLPLPGGIEVMLPARQASDLDQDVIAHKRGDRFSQAPFTQTPSFRAIADPEVPSTKPSITA